MKKVHSCKINHSKDIYNEITLHVYYLLSDHTTRDSLPVSGQWREGRKYQNMENYKNQKSAAQKYVYVQSGIFANLKFCTHS